MKLLTDWVNIGRSGPTIDGREIKPEWLTDCAETYDPKLYTAVINVDHYYGNLGDVEELRTVQEEQDLILQARVSPNVNYLRRNADGEKKFLSIEVQPNFRKSGRAYLVGLAATDRPASPSTTKMRFSAKSGEETFCAESVEMDPTVFKFTTESGDETPGWFKKFADWLADRFNIQPNRYSNNKEDPEMNEDFTKAFAGLGEQMSTLTTLLTKFIEAQPKPGTEAPAAPVTASATPAAPADAPPSANFNTELLSKVTELTTAVTDLGAKFDKAMTESAGTTPVVATAGAAADKTITYC